MYVLFAACNKEQDLSTIDLGYAFFPAEVGSFIIYDVDSVFYGSATSTYHYQVMEELTGAFVDDEGQDAVYVERSYRNAPSGPWLLMDVWTQRRTPTTAEKVEENMRYIKMKFPVKDGDTWNGNGFNNFAAQQYKFKDLNAFKDVGVLQFEKTVTVEEKNNVNLIDQEIFYEIYAPGIGMVSRRACDISYSAGAPSGFDVIYSAVLYGKD